MVRHMLSSLSRDSRMDDGSRPPPPDEELPVAVDGRRSIYELLPMGGAPPTPNVWSCWYCVLFDGLYPPPRIPATSSC